MTRVVGLTGNVASGKSSVAAALATKGATVIDADVLAREAVQPGTPALAAIGARWPSVIASGGTLDRAKLRAIVFADARERAALNAIVHPEVAKLRDRALAAARACGDAVVIYDVPLLFEAGLQHTVDVIVVVDAPEAVRRERLVRERGYTVADANAAIAAQAPASGKREAADFVIENDGTRAQLAERVDALWNALRAGAA